MSSTQKEIKIKLTDSKYIFGSLIDTGHKEYIVILAHGFTGHKDEHILYNTAKFLEQKGIDSFRFNFYSYQPNARKFIETKISQHGEDLTQIYKYFLKKYKKIFIVGHSFGGTSILFSDTDLVSGTIFWDASYITSKNSDFIVYNKNTKQYICDWSTPILVGSEFVQELRNFKDCAELVKNIKVPKLFITAGLKGQGNKKAGKIYMKESMGEKKLINIPQADHCFNNPKDEKVLIEQTYAWIKR